MSRRLIFRPGAKADLTAIADFFAPDGPDRAQRLIDSLRQRCEIFLAHPFAGRPRDEFGQGIRSLSERPYVIFYRVHDDDVEILAVLHGARDLPVAMRARLEKDSD